MRKVAFIEFDSTKHPADALAGHGGEYACATFHAYIGPARVMTLKSAMA